MILNALADQPLPVYGDGLNVRDWIHVEDHCDAIARVLAAGKEGEVYNVGGRSEKPNIEIVKSILNILGKPAVADPLRGRSSRSRSALRHRRPQDRARARLDARPPLRRGAKRHRRVVSRQRAVVARHQSGEYTGWYERNYGGAEPRSEAGGARRRRTARPAHRAGSGARRARRLRLHARAVRHRRRRPGARPRDRRRRRHQLRGLHQRRRAEADEDGAFRANALGAEHVARAAAAARARLVHVSTDFVFDGLQSEPYDEFARPTRCRNMGAASARARSWPSAR